MTDMLSTFAGFVLGLLAGHAIFDAAAYLAQRKERRP